MVSRIEDKEIYTSTKSLPADLNISRTIPFFLINIKSCHLKVNGSIQAATQREGDDNRVSCAMLFAIVEWVGVGWNGGWDANVRQRSRGRGTRESLSR